MKIARWLAPALLAISALGCGKSPVTESGTTPTTSGPTVAKESTGDATTPADGDSYLQPIVNTPAAVLPVDASSPPEKVVEEFLNAMKTSNDGVAAGLLTATAREETARHGMAVQPPGSPTAEYEVTQAELSEEDPTIAQVGCVWTEKDTTGADRSEQVVWVLRKHSEGWRVFGMGTQMPSREEPVFFNFEDPEGMNALIDEINAEMTAKAAKPDPAQDDGGIRKARKSDDGETNSLRR